MSLTERQLIALLRLALTGEQEAVLSEHIDWEAIREMAEQQSVLGITFAGIERLPRQMMPAMPILMDWVGQAEKIKTLYDSHQKAVARLARLMEKNNISYVVFKGIAVASCYGSIAKWRAVGDVDFYVPQWDFNRAIEVIEREWKVEIEKEEVDKHFSFSKKDVHFEMHYQMETFGCDRYQTYFSKLIDDYLKCGALSYFTAADQRVVMLSPALDMMLVMKHWMTHLIGEGVGLRQTTDMAVQIKVYKDMVDIATLQHDLTAIGYRKAFDAVVAMTEKYFGVRWELYAVAKSSYNDADRLIATIAKNGNFGRADYHYRTGKMKRVETTWRFFKHCLRFLNLAPWDILCVIPKRVMISLKAH